MALQGDGKIVAGGFAERFSSASFELEFALVRYNLDGSRDNTFGDDGRVTTGFNLSEDAGQAVAIQSDGKIVVAGSSNASGTFDFALARYNSDGSLDMTFDGDGKVTTDFAGGTDEALAVTFQEDKIIAAGYDILPGHSGWDFALARYQTDGSLDSTFGGDGKVTTDFAGAVDVAFDVATQGDGKIVAAGSAGVLQSVDCALARYGSDGTLDSTFGGDGKVTTDFASKGDSCEAVSIQRDGKIVTAGSTFSGDLPSDADFALLRFIPDGSLDSSFSSDGKVTTDFAGGLDHGNGLAIQRDGKILVGGVSGGNFAVARYDTDGSLDSTFGGEGKVTTSFSSGWDEVQALVVERSGKVVAAGSAQVSQQPDFAVARYSVCRRTSGRSSILCRQ